MTRQIGPSRSYELFAETVKYIQSEMEKTGTPISDEDVARKIDMPMTTYLAYLQQDIVPQEVFQKIRREFGDVLKKARFARAYITFEVDIEDEEEHGN